MTIVSTKTGSATRGELWLAPPPMQANRRMEPDVTRFHEAATGTVQYVVPMQSLGFSRGGHSTPSLGAEKRYGRPR
jgi:hypothetical protein